jgi:hypothetical protein
MEDTLLFSPALEIRHLNLVTVRHVYEAIPLVMASYEVGRGRLKKAIEALERGRPPMWSEFRGLRNSIHELAVDSHFAKEFTEVNPDMTMMNMNPKTARGWIWITMTSYFNYWSYPII